MINFQNVEVIGILQLMITLIFYIQIEVPIFSHSNWQFMKQDTPFRISIPQIWNLYYTKEHAVQISKAFVIPIRHVWFLSNDLLNLRDHPLVPITYIMDKCARPMWCRKAFPELTFLVFIIEAEQWINRRTGDCFNMWILSHLSFLWYSP